MKRSLQASGFPALFAFLVWSIQRYFQGPQKARGYIAVTSSFDALPLTLTV
jgi:hypothetical protein